MKKRRGSQQVPILHGISRDHYAMHATQLFIDRSGVPLLMSGVPHACGTPDRKSTLFKLVVNFFLKGVVFMFWHDIVYIELVYCVTTSKHVLTWNKVAVVKNVKSVNCTPPPNITYAPKIVFAHSFARVRWTKTILVPPQPITFSPRCSATLLLHMNHQKVVIVLLESTTWF